MLARWSRHLARPALARANVRRVAEAAAARQAFRRMLAAQGLAWPA
jgi:hypothetical protein